MSKLLADFCINPLLFEKKRLILHSKSARTGCTSVIQTSLIALGLHRPCNEKKTKVNFQQRRYKPTKEVRWLCQSMNTTEKKGCGQWWMLPLHLRRVPLSFLSGQVSWNLLENLHHISDNGIAILQTVQPYQPRCQQTGIWFRERCILGGTLTLSQCRICRKSIANRIA